MANPDASGRYALVGEGEDLFLYHPKAFTLFDLPSEAKESLSRASNNFFFMNSPELNSICTDLAFVSFLEMLAPEVRNRESNDRDKPTPEHTLKDVVLNISQLCNLDCVYCYATDLNKKKKIMTSGTIDVVLEKLFSMSPDGLDSLKFLGGEPTLAFPSIEYTVEKVRAHCEEHSIAPPVFVIVTNGMKLSEHQIAFLSSNKFYVLVSVDGPRNVHDFLRPALGGQGSHNNALRSLERLRIAGCNVAVECVYTSAHIERGVRISHLVDYFLSLGIREMQITIALGQWHGVSDYRELDKLTNDFVDCAKRSVASMATDDPFLLRSIRFAIENFIRGETQSHVCGAGRTFMAVNHDGEAFPCYLLENAETSYGVIGKSWNDAIRKEITKRFDENGKADHLNCRKCWAKEICQSCLGSSFLISGSIDKPPTWFCGIQKSLISATLGEIAKQMKGKMSPEFHSNLSKLLRQEKFQSRGFERRHPAPPGIGVARPR